MNTKTISPLALTLIDQYLHFKVHPDHAVSVAVPYYNNRRKGARGELRALVGKGSPKDIADELVILALRAKVSLAELDTENMRKFMIDHNIGIDCSALAYYLLQLVSRSKERKSLDRHLSFPYCKSIWALFRAKMQPVKHTNVRVLAHPANSRVLNLCDVEPGDFVTMLGSNEDGSGIRDHIILVHEIEYVNLIPTRLHYTHSIAWPSDGQYGHGVRQGTITITDVNRPLQEQVWDENSKNGPENYTWVKSTESLTELRRLIFL